MKLMTLLGTRPEIIRLSVIIKLLDRLCDHTLVHTGQNYDPNLSEVFFEDLELRQPTLHLGVRDTDFARQTGQILAGVDNALDEYKPDRLLVLGDTNSALGAIVAAKRGIPVFHLEAGNRCYDDRVPEEINRRIVDHCSTVLMPYTHRSKENLLREGIDRDRIFVIGNPIYEVLKTFAPQIEACDALGPLNLEPNDYFLVTMHRAENVDNKARLASLLEGFELLGEQHRQPIIISLHPRTANRLQEFNLEVRSKYIKLLNPMSFFQFVALEKKARCVLSDSGTVQEECCILQVPNVTIRDVTERPETIECGSSILSGSDPVSIQKAVDIALNTSHGWKPPAEYVEEHVSTAVVKIMLGYGLPASRTPAQPLAARGNPQD
jgi:UDP-N-acetylglucosamine 2-epimerase (non-hydrolysing)